MSPRCRHLISRLLAAGLAPLCISGCGPTLFQPAPTDRSPLAGGLSDDATLPSEQVQAEHWRSPDAWPSRLRLRTGIGEWGRKQVPADRPLMGTIIRVKGPIEAAGGARPAQEKFERELYADAAELISRRIGADWTQTHTIVGEGAGSYLFVTSDDPNATEVWDGPAGKPAYYFKFASIRPLDSSVSGPRELVWALPATPDAKAAAPSAGPQPTPASNAPSRASPARRIMIERTWFALYDPAVSWTNANQRPGASGPTNPSRGLVVLLPGMFGTPTGVVRELVGTLRREGWTVLRMLAHPSRFTEQVTFGIVGDADLQPQAELVASVMGDRAAECAYAVQSAVTHVLDQRPGIRAAPRIVLGMSGGAMVLPTVVARDPSLYDGALVIAGGTNFFRLAIDSNYRDMIDAIHFMWFEQAPRSCATQLDGPWPAEPAAAAPSAPLPASPAPAAVRGKSTALASDQRPSPEFLARFNTAYLRAAPLDPTFTGAALRQLKTLFFLADGDRAVPFAQGEQLWQIAGRPDRYLHSGGHETLFLTLDNSFGRITDWLASVPRRPPSAPTLAPSQAAAP